jgi:hypothetical protein
MKDFMMNILKWQKEKNMNWVSQAFIAMLSISVMLLIFKRLTQLKLKPEIVNFFLFLVYDNGILGFYFD